MNRGEYRWVVWVSLAIVVAASFPYLIGYGTAPPGYRFIGLTYNIDDACVYLSWMRQAADGHFFLRNLFTTEPQVGRGFNLLFYCLGTFARFAHLPLVAVFHLARIVFGFALLLAVYGFSGVWLKDVRSRRIALLVVGLSSGFGWLFTRMQGIARPVDLWQPEAITFLGIYLSPLFTFPTLLIVGTLYFLHRYTVTGAWKYAGAAGVLLMLLANVHTYDLITLAVTWGLYSGYWLAQRPRDLRPVAGGALAGLIAAPMAAYQVYVYLGEPVLRTRVAVPTLSPGIVWYLLGFGLLIPLAILGIHESIKERRQTGLLICWAAAGFITVYLPVSFQRKLIMGTHIPLSLMATLGLTGLAGYLAPRWRTALLTLAIAVMLPSNLYFISRDAVRVVSNEAHTTGHVPFISENELKALAYLRDHTRPDDVILSVAGLAVLIPGFTGRQVYYGHWGETPDFAAKLRKVSVFYRLDTSDQERRAFLKKCGITYVVGYHGGSTAEMPFVDFEVEPASYLKPVFSTEEVTVYRVAME